VNDVSRPHVPASATAGRRPISGWVAAGLLLLAFIVVPFLLWGDRLDGWVAGRDWRALGALEAAVLGGALLAADVLLPVPSNLVSTALGLVLGIGWGTVVSTLGMTLACLLGYALGRAAGVVSLHRFVAAEAALRAAEWIRRHGVTALVICRAVPVLAEASVLVAGALRLGPLRVLLATSLANLGVSFAYTALGATTDGTTTFLLAFALSLAVPVVSVQIARRVERRRAPPA
jgi:uncharacterized membrane protein YdjX (TVP38/TMEM64 family)